MAVKNLNARLTLKYDTYLNWTTNNPKLLAGEVAIATIPAPEGAVKQAPSVLMKVGDGEKLYNELNFVSGLAANVSAWALADTKPVYKADEIDGLADYISGEIQDTNTTYQMVKVDDYNYKLQSKELNGDWTDVAGGTIVIPKYDDTQVKADIDALEALVGETAVATQIANAITALDLANTYDAKGAAATAEANAKTYTDALANGAVKTNTDAIAAIKDGATIDSFADVETALAGKDAAGAAEAALASAKTYTDTAVKVNTDAIAAIKDGTTIDSFADVETALAGKETAGAAATAESNAKGYTDTAIATLTNGAVKDAADAAAAAQGDVDALEAKVGTVADDTTVVDMIGAVDTKVGTNTGDITELKGKVAALEAGTYDDTEVRGLIAGNTSAIDAIEADYLKAADKEALQTQITANANAVAAEKERAEGVESGLTTRVETMEAFWKAAQADGTDSNVVDTLKEIQEYIASDETGASAMAASIKQNTDAIAVLNGEAEGSVKKTVADAIAAENLAQYATDDELAAAIARIATNEADIVTLEAASHTHDNKTILDGVTAEKVTAWDDAAAKAHEHANKTVLDGVTAEKVAAWDAAEANAKAHAEAKVKELTDGAVATNTAAIAAIKDGTTIDSFADVEADLATKQTAIEANAAAAKAAQDDVDALEAKAVVDGDTLVINCGTSVIA